MKYNSEQILKSDLLKLPAYQGPEGRTLPLQGHVGFDSLPDQLVNKCVNLGFDMNILCVGETGIGKSTLMDCLFKANFDGEYNLWGIFAWILSTVFPVTRVRE